jgi:transposase
MDKCRHQFTEEEVAELKKYRDKQKDKRLALRFVALLMLAENDGADKVAEVIGKSVRTIENWLKQYVEKGIDSLNSFQYVNKKSYLTPEQIKRTADWVRETNPATLKEVAAYIRENFNVKYKLESVRIILKKEGLGVVTPKIRPGNPPSAEKQKEFVRDYFEMKESCEPGTAFLFGDGMHLVHQNIAGQCWGDPRNPPILKTNTGRQRLNILGAYNAETHEFFHLTGEENCNAERVIKYLELLLESNRHAPSVVLFLDNARYFKAKIVTDWLDSNKKIQIKFLPAYSPNLNLIERFWRFTKGKLVKNQYYEKYKTFRAKVFQFLNHVDEYVEEFSSLMVEKFQIIEEA